MKERSQSPNWSSSWFVAWKQMQIMRSREGFVFDQKVAQFPDTCITRKSINIAGRLTNSRIVHTARGKWTELIKERLLDKMMYSVLDY